MFLFSLVFLIGSPVVFLADYISVKLCSLLFTVNPNYNKLLVVYEVSYLLFSGLIGKKKWIILFVQFLRFICGVGLIKWIKIMFMRNWTKPFLDIEYDCAENQKSFFILTIFTIFRVLVENAMYSTNIAHGNASSVIFYFLSRKWYFEHRYSQEEFLTTFRLYIKQLLKCCIEQRLNWLDVFYTLNFSSICFMHF